MTDKQKPESGATPAAEAPDTLAAETLPLAPSIRPSFPGQPASNPRPSASPPASRRPPRPELAALPTVDRATYAVEGEIAHGGIGRVLRARDERLKRPVAIKELLKNDPAGEDRFVQEALLTARLQHPSIIPIYEAGRWPEGDPFYAMKLVSGRPLADLIDERPALDQRLGLLLHVLSAAEAVAYAHSQRIIHRDLKPHNILIGELGETVVIDWGIAKDLASAPGQPDEAPGAPPRARRLTAPGIIVGTPAYMPPEQAYGAAVDERSDVYALGAILYHLLAGEPPYVGPGAREVLNKLVSEPPPPLEQRQRGVPQDLAAIVRKAMARQPEERYPSARELAEELRRFQTGQVVRAHRYSTLELLGRFIRRHKAALSVAAAAALILSVLAVLGVRRILIERDRAEEARRQAVGRADDLTLVEARNWVERDPNRSIAWLKSLSPSFSDWGVARTIAADAEAHGIARVFLGHTDAVSVVRFSPDSHLIATSSDDKGIRLWDVATGKSRVLAGHTDEAWDIDFSPDGRTVATTGKDKTARLWSVETGEARVLEGHTGPVRRVKYFPDGKLLVTSSDDGSVRLWDSAGNPVRTLNGPAGRMMALDVSPDGQWIVSGSKDGIARLWRVSGEGPALLTGHEKEIFNTSFSRDGERLATSGADNNVWIWDVESRAGKPLKGHTAVVRSATFLPGDKTLATIADDATLRIWDLETESARVLHGHGGILVSIDISPDGSMIATGSFDHTVRVWDVATGTSRVLYGSGDQEVLGVDFSPDGKWIAFGNRDGAVRLVEARPGRSEAFTGHAGEVRELFFLRSGDRILSAGADGSATLWSRRGSGAAAPPVALSGHQGGLVHAAISADGSRLATAGEDQMIRLWDQTGQLLRPLDKVENKINRIVISPDGKQLAAAGAFGVSLWSTASGERRALYSGAGGAAFVDFSPDGKSLAAACSDKTVRVWEVSSGQERVLKGHEADVMVLAFSPAAGAALLASGSVDHTVRFWDLSSGAARSVNVGGSVVSIAFSPDGRMIIPSTIGFAGVRLIDVATGQDVRVLGGHEGFITEAAFSPDGRVLATASLDRTVRLWDLESGDSRVIRGHKDAVLHVAFSPDGESVAAGGRGGSVLVFPDDLPHEPDALRAWLGAATPETIDVKRRAR